MEAVPSSKRCFPAAQATHSVCNEASELSLSLYFPAPQTVQSAVASLLNFAMAQVLQVDAEVGSYQSVGPSFPRGQTEQDPIVKELTEP